MNFKFNFKKILGALVGILLIALIVVRLKSNKEISQNKIFHYDKEKAINVKVDTLTLKPVGEDHVYSGTFEPNRETKISADAQGKIEDVLVDVGSVVCKGQPLVQLDNSLLKLQLQNTEVQIEGFEADVNRYAILAKADAVQGVQLEKATLGLKSAKLQKATILEQIQKTTIRSPFNGIVTSKMAEAGAFASPGVPLLQITDIATLKFTINVAENELDKFQINQTYSISADAQPEVTFPGKVTMIGSKANLGNSFPVQFALSNTKDLSIKAGMFGKVSIKNERGEKAIIIPTSAIQEASGLPQVYMVKNGKAVLQKIELAKKSKDKALVTKGLSEGDILITSGIINLFDGANVTIK